MGSSHPDIVKRCGGGGGLKKTFLGPFGPRFGLNIRGGRAPRAPPLDPPMNRTLHKKTGLNLCSFILKALYPFSYTVYLSCLIIKLG